MTLMSTSRQVFHRCHQRENEGDCHQQTLSDFYTFQYVSSGDHTYTYIHVKEMDIVSCLFVYNESAVWESAIVSIRNW